MIERWELLYNEAGDNQDFKPCVPIAFAILTGLSYAEMNEAFIRHGRRRRCSVNDKTRDKVADALNVNFCRLEGLPINEPKTTSALHKWLESNPQKGKFLIKVNRHLLAVTKNKVQDWSRHKRLKIKAVWLYAERNNQLEIKRALGELF